MIHVPPGTSAAPTPSPDSPGMSLVPVASPSTQSGAICSFQIAPAIPPRVTGRRAGAAPTPPPDSRGMSLVPVAPPPPQSGAICSPEIAPDIEHRITGSRPGAVTMEKSPLSLQSVMVGLCVDPCGPPACDPHGPAGPLQPIAQ